MADPSQWRWPAPVSCSRQDRGSERKAHSENILGGSGYLETDSVWRNPRIRHGLSVLLFTSMCLASPFPWRKVFALARRLAIGPIAAELIPAGGSCGMIWRRWFRWTKAFWGAAVLSKESDSWRRRANASSGPRSGDRGSRAVLQQLRSGQDVDAQGRQSVLRRHHLYLARCARAGDVHARFQRHAGDCGECPRPLPTSRLTAASSWRINAATTRSAMSAIFTRGSAMSVRSPSSISRRR